MPRLLPLRLQRRRPGRIRPTLDRLEHALAALGDPQCSFPSVLVVGTNGKGSTAAILERLLAAHGRRIGLYTSPHLVRVEERIRVDGRALSPEALEAYLTRLEPFPELTFFETLTAAAFLAFVDGDVDVAVLEAGMGGRWDATRLARSAVAGLTNVGSDHAAWLGSTPEEIASDKAAALLAARRAVLGPAPGHPLPPEASGHAVPAASLVRLTPSGAGRLAASWDGVRVSGLVPPLVGKHQVANLHLALALARSVAAEGWVEPLAAERVPTALAEVSWPGRLSSARVGIRTVLLDGAHNLEGAEALARYLAAAPIRYNLVFSCLADKPARRMLDRLRPVVGDIAMCPLDDERGLPVSELVAACPDVRIAADPRAAMDSLPDPVLAAGSLRLVGALLAEAS